MLTVSKHWRVLLSVMVLMGALGGPLAARAEEPEPPLTTYDANWTGGTAGLALASASIPGSSIEAADDFILPAGPTYGLITNINVTGEYSTGFSTFLSSVSVRVYNNASNLPGTLVYSQTVSVTGGSSSGSFQLALPNAAAVRTNQTYWVSVYAKFTGFNNWFWTTRSPQTGNPATRRDDIQGSNCLNVWAIRATCDPNIQYGPDLYFQLIYTPFTPTEFIYLPTISR